MYQPIDGCRPREGKEGEESRVKRGRRENEKGEGRERQS